jgi:hypothetical protein
VKRAGVYHVLAGPTEECLKLGCAILALRWNGDGDIPQDANSKVEETVRKDGASLPVFTGTGNAPEVSGREQRPRSSAAAITSIPSICIYVVAAAISGIAFSFVDSLFGAYA